MEKDGDAKSWFGADKAKVGTRTIRNGEYSECGLNQWKLLTMEKVRSNMKIEKHRQRKSENQSRKLTLHHRDRECK